MVEADRILLRNVQREADELEDDLRRIQDLGSQLQADLRRDREESSTRVEVQRQLERQVAQAKSHLSDLRERRASMNVDSVTMGGDRAHFSKELDFLRDSLEEETSMLEKLKSANEYLERSHKAHTDHAHQLENQRKEVLEMLETENRLVQRDERQTEEVRAALERLRREQGDSKGVTAEEVDLLRPRRPSASHAAADADNWLRSPPGSAPALRTPQPGSHASSPGIHLRTPGASTPARRSGASTPKSEMWRDDAAGVQMKAFASQFNPHSWASSLVGGTFGLPAASVCSSGGDPRSREGV
jgi:hypothetical protein